MFASSRSDRRRNRTRGRLSLEMLEGRQLMTLGAQFPTPINTTPIGGDFTASAISANGSSVVVYTATPNHNEVLAQRLNSAGVKVGPAIFVGGNDNEANAPSVAIDNQGDFVVAFTQNQPNGNTFVLARKFGPSGNAIGGNVPVAVGTFAQTDPSVAMDAEGDFVVSYTRDTNYNNPDVFAKLYNVNEQQVAVISVATTPDVETNSSVAMTPGGGFDVAYEVAGPTHFGIQLSQYGAQGAVLHQETITTEATNPSLSVDNLGDAVVAWSGGTSSASEILARRVSSTGAQGPVLTVASSPVFELGNASVALKRDGSGGFVVAYDSDERIELAGGDIDMDDQVLVAEVSPSNTITTLDAGTDFLPAVSINNSGQYLLTYLDSLDDDDVLGRFGKLPASTVPPLPGPTR
jgi:hypothetical protein